MPPYIAEERRAQLHCCENLKTRSYVHNYFQLIKILTFPGNVINFHESIQFCNVYVKICSYKKVCIIKE
jgi:hypothetical protein